MADKQSFKWSSNMRPRENDEYLKISVKKHKMREASNDDKNSLPLNSLARVIEGTSKCAAVGLISREKLILVNNEMRSKTGGTDGLNEQRIKLIHKIIEYLQSSDETIADKKEIFTMASKLVLKESESKVSHLYNFDKGDAIIEQIIAEQYADHNAFENKSLKEIYTIHLGNDYKKSSTNIKNEIISTYNILQRLSHDFKKVMDHKEEFSQIPEYEIIKGESEGVHAELRVINYFYDNYLLIGQNKALVKPKALLEIGISKLPCIDCRASMTSFNKVIKSELGLASDIIEYNSTSNRTENTHGIKFTNWNPPFFMEASANKDRDNPRRVKEKEADNISSLKRKITAEYRIERERLEKIIKLTYKEDKYFGSQHETPSGTSSTDDAGKDGDNIIIPNKIAAEFAKYMDTGTAKSEDDRSYEER